MLRKLLTENYEIDQAQLIQNIYRSLEGLHQKLEAEIINKQSIIDGCLKDMTALQASLSVKDQVIQALEIKIAANQHSIEGNRQLINKLLNDLDRMQQNVEWYKRTYEDRSLLGVIKDKLKQLIS